jgi:hypothetical protein
MRYRPRVLSWLVVAMVFALLGCSEPSGRSGVARVSGTVTLDDAPLAGANVQFLPENPKELHLGAFGADTSSDGKFERVLGQGMYAQPGRFVVVITKGAGVGAPPPAVTGPKDEDKTKELMKIGPGKAGGSLPAIYGSRDQSPFKVELKLGINEVGPFHLKSKGK